MVPVGRMSAFVVIVNRRHGLVGYVVAADAPFMFVVLWGEG